MILPTNEDVKKVVKEIVNSEKIQNIQKDIWKNTEKPLIDVIPLADRIIVETIEEATTTPGGLVLPENSIPRPSTGKVLAVGKGRRGPDTNLYPPDVEVGDIVVFDRFAGNKIKHDNKEYKILREDEVMAKIPQEEKTE